MNPHAIDFTKSQLSPKYTPTKRRILGEIQLPNSPIERLKSPLTKSPKSFKSPPQSINSPLLNRTSPFLNQTSPLNRISPLSTRVKRSRITKVMEERSRFKMSNKENAGSFISKISNKENEESFICKISKNETEVSFISKISNKENEVSFISKMSKKENEQTYISKMSNKETQGSFISESFTKLDVEEETRDFLFAERFEATREEATSWSTKVGIAG